jgi:hypothetical protein
LRDGEGCCGEEGGEEGEGVSHGVGGMRAGVTCSSRDR